MGKSKNLHRKPEEYLIGQLRRLKKDLKRKDQRIKQLERQLNFKVEEEPSPKKKEESIKCTSCGKGELSILDIGIRVYTICSICKDRKKI